MISLIFLCDNQPNYNVFLTHGNVDNFIHNGNFPMVWVSVGLAVQDSNVSLGMILIVHLWSEEIYFQQ